MNPAPLSETIVAISTGWGASRVGVIRLSGPDSRALIKPLIRSDLRSALDHQPRSLRFVTRLCISADGEQLEAPAELLLFFAPRSYTGQDVVEIHTLGSPPWLRMVCEELIARGARRALPGEFTSRAWLNGRMSVDAVVSVQALLSAESEVQARDAARLAHGGHRETIAAITEEILDLLALIEAGIDFTDEEDVRFIEPADAIARIDRILARMTGAERAEAAITHSRPRVAIAGLPNAGKSTLYNALLGTQRAITSPVIGATRDVLSADVRVGSIDITLQDCAGLGHTPGDVELAAHHAAEAAADLADLVLWAHDSAAPWTDAERAAFARVSPDRVLVVATKADLAGEVRPSWSAVNVCAHSGFGMDRAKRMIADRLQRQSWGAPGILGMELAPARKSLLDAKKILDYSASDPAWPELVSIAIRESLEPLTELGQRATSEAILGRIYSQFCVGKCS